MRTNGQILLKTFSYVFQLSRTQIVIDYWPRWVHPVTFVHDSACLFLATVRDNLFLEVECDQRCQKVLAARMAEGLLPSANLVADVRGFSGKGSPAVGLTAGFPCQALDCCVSKVCQVNLTAAPESKRLCLLPSFFSNMLAGSFSSWPTGRLIRFQEWTHSMRVRSL